MIFRNKNKKFRLFLRI